MAFGSTFNAPIANTGLILCICVGSVLYCVHFEVSLNTTHYNWYDFTTRQPTIKNTSINGDPEMHVQAEKGQRGLFLSNINSLKRPPTEMVKSPTSVYRDRSTMAKASKSTTSQKLKTILVWSRNVQQWTLQHESLKLKRCQKQPCELLRSSHQLAEGTP